MAGFATSSLQETKWYAYEARDAAANRRVTLILSEPDYRTATRPVSGYRGMITDLMTGKRYRAFGPACWEVRCVCDSLVVETLLC